MRKKELEKLIQLKEVEIQNYLGDNKQLQRLKNELQILNNELEDREDQREIVVELGYSRIGLWGKK